MLLNLVCSEVSLISVPRYMWLIDSNATIDISLPMQGCLDCRKPNDDERYIYMGDGKKVEVKAIGKFKLLLKVRFNLDLNKIFITSSFRQKLNLIPNLDKYGFSCTFGSRQFNLFHDSKLVGSNSLSGYDNIYLIDMVVSFNKSLQFSTRELKRKLTNKNSTMLWHKKLGHIYRWRIERLLSDEILDLLDFIDFNVC